MPVELKECSVLDLREYSVEQLVSELAEQVGEIADVAVVVKYRGGIYGRSYTGACDQAVGMFTWGAHRALHDFERGDDEGE